MERDKLAEAIESLRITRDYAEHHAPRERHGLHMTFEEWDALYATLTTLNEPPTSYNPPVEGSMGAEVGEYTPAEIEFIQCLFDRYSENGGIIDLAQDHPAFMRIVRKYVATTLSQAHEAGRREGILESVKVARDYRWKWSNAGGFEGFATGAKIIADEINALLKGPNHES